MISNGQRLIMPETARRADSGTVVQKFPPLEKYNWLIHLQHVRGEIQMCKTLIKVEIDRSDGRNIFALHKKGEIEREEGKLQDALESFQACLKLIPGSANTLKEVGKCLNTPDFIVRLETNTTKLSYIVIENALSWIMKLHNMNDTRLPKICYERSITNLPTKFNWMSQIREYFEGVEKYDLYDDFLVVSRKSNQKQFLDSYQTYSQRQDILRYEMCRFKLSMEAYLEAEAASHTPDWQIYYDLGRCFLKLGDIDKAREYAHRAVQIAKQESCYALLMKILMLQGDLKSAVAVANAAVESYPDSANMLTESGLLHLKEGQSQHAFERLSSALALEPAFPKALLGIGYITQKHREYDVALTKYKTAIHYQPDSVALWNNIGMCFYSKQKYVAAISCLKRALWMHPLNWRTLFNLGLAHLATSQPASAFNFACAAVNLRPDVADCFAVLGASLMELEDSDNAARAFNQSLLLSPEDLHLIVNGSICCLAAGLEDQAADLLRKFHALIGNGATCTDELLNLAGRVSMELEKIEPKKDHRIESLADTSSPSWGNQNSQSDKEKHADGEEQVDMLRTSREIIGRELKPDEV